MSELVLCDACGRHVKSAEARCPFCDHSATRPSVVRSAGAVLFAVAAAASVAACYGGPRRSYDPQPNSGSPGSETTPAPSSDGDGGTLSQGPTIGVATMLADGTLELQLRAEDGRGALGEGLFRYVPQHPQYGEVLAHLGPMTPGQRRAVRPF